MALTTAEFSSGLLKFAKISSGGGFWAGGGCLHFWLHIFLGVMGGFSGVRCSHSRGFS